MIIKQKSFAFDVQDIAAEIPHISAGLNGYANTDQVTFVEPPGLTEDQREVWLNACMDAEAAYYEMIGYGVDPKIAEIVLPLCTYLNKEKDQ